MSLNASLNNNNVNNNVNWDKLSPKELYQRSLIEGVEGDEAQKQFHERIQSCSRRQLADLAEELINAKETDAEIHYSIGCIDSLVLGLGGAQHCLARKLHKLYLSNSLNKAPIPFELEDYCDRYYQISLTARNINQGRMSDGKTLGHVLAAQGEISRLEDFVKAGGSLCVRDHTGKLPIDYVSLSDDPAGYCAEAYLIERLNQEEKTNLTDEEWGYFESMSGSLPAETKVVLEDINQIKEYFPPEFSVEILEDALELGVSQQGSAKLNTLVNLNLLIQHFGSAWKHGLQALEGAKNEELEEYEENARVMLGYIKDPAIRSCKWATLLLASDALDSVDEHKAVEDLKESLHDFLSTISNADLLAIARSRELRRTSARKYLFKLVAPGHLPRCQYTDSYSVKSFEHYESEIVNQAVLENGWQSLVLTPEDGWENAAQEKKDKNAVFGSVLAHAIDRLDEEVAEKKDLRQVYSYLCAVRQVTEVLRGHPAAVQFGSTRKFISKDIATVSPIVGSWVDYLFEKILKISDRNVSADWVVDLSLPNKTPLKLTRVLFNRDQKFIIHPVAEETMEALFDDAQADFAELMAGDLDEEAIWEKLAKVYWNLVHGMPSSRGNASICLALCSLVWRANGIEPPCLKPGIIPDLEVLLGDPSFGRDSFIPKFKGLFDTSIEG